MGASAQCRKPMLAHVSIQLGGEEHLRFGRVDTDRGAQKLENGPDKLPGTV